MRYLLNKSLISIINLYLLNKILNLNIKIFIYFIRKIKDFQIHLTL